MALKTKCILFLIALTALVYGPFANNGFVWDDHLNIAGNPFVQSPSNLPKIFTREYLTAPSDLLYMRQRPIGAGEMSYRPVVTLTYFLDYALWGPNPFGFHLTGLLLHLLNVCLMFALARRLFSDDRLAFLAAAVFAVHPVQNEAVMVAAFREDLLVFSFGVGALLLFLRNRFLLSWLCYALAVLSKESAVMVPFLVFFYERYFRGKERGAVIRRYGGFALVTLAYLIVWAGPMARPHEDMTGYPGGSFYTNILTMLKVFAGYIVWMIFPADVHPTLRDPGIFAKTLFSPGVILSLGLVAGCIFWALYYRRRRKVMSFGIFWFFTALLPVANFIPIHNIMAARYLYLPAAGFALCFAAGVNRVLAVVRDRTKSRGSLITTDGIKAAVLVVLVFYVIQTVSLGMVWSNELTFRRAMIRWYPHRPEAHESMGEAYLKIGLYDWALPYFEKVKEMKPDMFEAYSNTGFIYLYYHMVDPAIEEFRQAVTIEPRLAEVYNTYCSLLAIRGRKEKAEACYRHIIRENPWYLPARHNMRRLLGGKGRDDGE